ncbi:MAG: pyridoxal phosphate-dependent aminotransferase, partial [Oscillospiraceae bacterium]
EPEATYLMWIDCRELNLAQEELNRFFTDEAKVGLNDGVSFGVEGAGFMRLNIACTRAVLEDGISRIKKAYDRKFK